MSVSPRIDETYPSGRGRLFWRVYLYGLALLVAVGISAIAVGHAFGRDGTRRELPRRLVAYLAEDLAGSLEDPKALERSLRERGKHFRMEISVRRVDGALLAATSEAPPPALGAAELERLRQGAFRLGRKPPLLVAPIPGADAPLAYLQGELPRPDVSLERPLTILGVILLVLALASFPFARSIAAPLERLTRAARELGRGDLSARSGLQRKDEVGVLAAAFDDMAEKMETLVQSQKELLANVSHELRTPLSRIRIALDLASEGDLAAARHYLGEIGSDLEELDRLIEDVLTIARVEVLGPAGMPLHPEAVEAGAFFEKVAARFARIHPERQLACDLAPDLGSFQADAVLLRRAVDNLLDNACNYSDGPVRLRATRRSGALEIEVEDSGIGIPAEDLRQLFTPFFRGDRSRTRNTGGIGLGLTLTRRILEAHGGEVAATSEPGVGTAFRLTLPIDQREA